MDAIAERVLPPMFLHPLQHGGLNLERAHCMVSHSFMFITTAGGVLNLPCFCFFLNFFQCRKLAQRSWVILLGTSRASRPKHSV